MDTEDDTCTCTDCLRTRTADALRQLRGAPLYGPAKVIPFRGPGPLFRSMFGPSRTDGPSTVHDGSKDGPRSEVLDGPSVGPFDGPLRRYLVETVVLVPMVQTIEVQAATPAYAASYAVEIAGKTLEKARPAFGLRGLGRVSNVRDFGPVRPGSVHGPNDGPKFGPKIVTGDVPPRLRFDGPVK